MFHVHLGDTETMRRKILMVGPFPPTVGGITSCIENIVNSRLKKLYEFIPFSTSRPTIGLAKDVSDYSILFKMNPRHLVSATATTFYHLIIYPIVLLAKAPELVHIHTTDYLPFFESSVYTLVARLFSKPTIIHIHATAFETFYDNGNAVTRALTRKILSMVDRIIVLSPNTAAFFKAIVSPCKVSIIPNAIEPSNSTKEQLFERIYPHPVLTVLFVGGEEAKRKGLFDILKAIPIVVDEYGPDLLFLFVGIYDREKQEAIREAETAYHCVKNVGFLESDEMQKVRLTSDIYILPSYAEGLPMALLEAMEAGLPVVSTRVGSIPELVEEGVNGFLIEPGDYEALAQSIVKLGRDRELRHTMGERNIEKVRASYSLENAMQKLNDLYCDVI